MTVSPGYTDQTVAYPVLIELFTSQGCSSCPPADHLLTKLEEIAQEQQVPLYAVSWHVDYWNHLGWRDPLSKPEFSERQRIYTQSLGENMYTPQMIINGRYAMIGSEVAQVQEYLNKSLAEPSSVNVQLKVTRVSPKEVTISYQLNGFWQNKELVIALVRKQDEINVAGGENMGRKLRHINSARQLMRLPLNSEHGVFNVFTPPIKQLSEYKVIAWAQDPQLMEVFGVGAVELPSMDI
jgi:hypothetical protein